jgi:hypothetical protein
VRTDLNQTLFDINSRLRNLERTAQIIRLPGAGGSGTGIDLSSFDFGIISINSTTRIVTMNAGYWVNGVNLAGSDGSNVEVSIPSAPKAYIYVELDAYNNVSICDVASPTFPMSTANVRRRCLYTLRGYPSIVLLRINYVGTIYT